MQIIDAHQHFWNYDPVRDSWIDESMSVLKKDFLPDDLHKLMIESGINGSIAVQASQSLDETEFLLNLSEQFSFIKGVVGWIDIQSPFLAEQLSAFKYKKKLKGFRHILQSEKNRSFMLQPEFVKGIEVLGKYGYTYDILIYKDQLKYLPSFISEFPEQKFVLDHLAKPDIKSKELKQWKQDMQVLKQFPNLYCKLSGFVTEADWHRWREEEFNIYFDVVMNTFGIDRVMFGSDWPVCLLSATYEEVLNILKNYFSDYSQDEQQKIFASNAITFYNL